MVVRCTGNHKIEYSWIPAANRVLPWTNNQSTHAISNRWQIGSHRLWCSIEIAHYNPRIKVSIGLASIVDICFDQSNRVHRSISVPSVCMHATKELSTDSDAQGGSWFSSHRSHDDQFVRPLSAHKGQIGSLANAVIARICFNFTMVNEKHLTTSWRCSTLSTAHRPSILGYPVSAMCGATPTSAPDS